MHALTPIARWLAAAALAAAAVAQENGREAVALGRSRDPALYDAFQSGYFLAASGDVERAEVITEFRRAVMIVRQHADLGEYSYNENNLARDMAKYRGLVTFAARIRLHPLHTHPAPPHYEMYVRTGPETKPVALTGVTREPLFPPGFTDTPASFTSFRIEGSATVDALRDAEDPALVITNDRGVVIWQVRLDLSRFR